MPKLFIANCTKQRQNFAYRLPEHPSFREQPIEIGPQIQVSGNLSQLDVSAIIEQHRVYGMIEVHEKAPQGFVGLCYSVDKPVPSTPIQDLILHNTEIMTNIGRSQRQEAAVAFNSMAENNVRQFGNDKDRVAELEVDIVEQSTSRGDKSDKLHENTMVVREDGKTGRRGRGRRAA